MEAEDNDRHHLRFREFFLNGPSGSGLPNRQPSVETRQQTVCDLARYAPSPLIERVRMDVGPKSCCATPAGPSHRLENLKCSLVTAFVELSFCRMVDAIGDVGDNAASDSSRGGEGEQRRGLHFYREDSVSRVPLQLLSGLAVRCGSCPDGPSDDW